MASKPFSSHRLPWAVGGLSTLALCAFASLLVADTTVRIVVVSAGVVVASVGMGGMLRASSRERRGTMAARSDATEADIPAPGPAADDVRDGVAHRILSDFRRWMREQEHDSPSWPAFDQFIREMLADYVGAVRVRCYRVSTGREELHNLAQPETPKTDGGSIARGGLFGHVTAMDREYLANDSGHGELLDRLAAESEESWDWVWPVRDQTATIGLVAVGTLSDDAVRNRGLRATVISLVGLVWEHVALLEQFSTAQRTDRGSGVLNRADFFDIAARALSDSYEAKEPVVVASLALEGLRYLDDGGMWQRRDALIEQLGQLLTRRVRTDDLVGRFSDDRFVVLLRRLDRGLGRLIVDQVLTEADACIVRVLGDQERIRIRAGLAASDGEPRSLDTLLEDAFGAVQAARKQGLRQCDDAAPVAIEASHAS